MSADLSNNATETGLPLDITETGKLEEKDNVSEGAEKRDELKQEAPEFTETEKLRYERAFDKPFKYADIPNLSLDELQIAKEKDGGIVRLLLSKSENEHEVTFRSLNNESFEWHVGLRDLVDGNVSEITLKIHPKNLEKGGNTSLIEKYPEAKNALEAYQKDPSDITYFERKNTQRDDTGNFSNEDGYFRIFTGDTWKVEKTLSPEEISASEKPASLAAALNNFGEDIKKEMEIYDIPPELSGMIFALMWHESRWNATAKNPSSTARGLGGLLKGSSLAMHTLLRKEGRDIPEDRNEFLQKMKTDQKLQIMAFVRFTKRMGDRLKKIDPALDPFTNPTERNLTFLAIAHHDGPTGAKAYIRWWKDHGSPDEIPLFPDKETAQRYMIAGFQKNRSLEGKEGTNGLITDSKELAERAKNYENQIASYFTESSSTS